MERALDIGCGQGFFTKELAQRVTYVDAIDIDSNILQEASQLHSSFTNINYIPGDFISFHLPANQYDIVTAIACIHHMDCRKALEKIRRVLKPGGVAAVLGLYLMTTYFDMATRVIAVPVDRINTYILHHHENTNIGMTAATREPSLSLAQIKKVSREIFPGSQFKRHLLFRYSIIWHKPNNSFT